jgi:hypothetical protein
LGHRFILPSAAIPETFDRLLHRLPNLIHIRRTQGRVEEGFADIVRMIARESALQRHGASLLVQPCRRFSGDLLPCQNNTTPEYKPERRPQNQEKTECFLLL